MNLVLPSLAFLSLAFLGLAQLGLALLRLALLILAPLFLGGLDRNGINVVCKRRRHVTSTDTLCLSIFALWVVTFFHRKL